MITENKRKTTCHSFFFRYTKKTSWPFFFLKNVMAQRVSCFLFPMWKPCLPTYDTWVFFCWAFFSHSKKLKIIQMNQKWRLTTSKQIANRKQQQKKNVTDNDDYLFIYKNRNICHSSTRIVKNRKNESAEWIIFFFVVSAFNNGIIYYDDDDDDWQPSWWSLIIHCIRTENETKRFTTKYEQFYGSMAMIFFLSNPFFSGCVIESIWFGFFFVLFHVS